MLFSVDLSTFISFSAAVDEIGYHLDNYHNSDDGDDDFGLFIIQ